MKKLIPILIFSVFLPGLAQEHSQSDDLSVSKLGFFSQSHLQMNSPESLSVGIKSGDSLEILEMTADCKDGQISLLDFDFGANTPTIQTRFSYGLSLEPETICQSCFQTGQNPPDSLRIFSVECAGSTDTMILKASYRRLESNHWEMGKDSLNITGTKLRQLNYPERLVPGKAGFPLLHSGYAFFPNTEDDYFPSWGVDIPSFTDSIDLIVHENDTAGYFLFPGSTLYTGRRFTLRNRNSSSVGIQSSDGGVLFIQEVLSNDKWLPIEGIEPKMCGMSFYPITVREKETLKFSAPIYMGDEFGYMRLKAEVKIYENGDYETKTIYSRPYKSFYNSRQILYPSRIISEKSQSVRAYDQRIIANIDLLGRMGSGYHFATSR